jgi:REP element-mobilizing transposase RayT
MGRGPRIEYAGAIFHVIQRGNNQEKIFERDMDKEFFLKILKDVAGELDSVIFGYVIMRNHFHLLAQIGDRPLSKVMHRLNGIYAGYYNRGRGRSGHVFQGRYKAYLIRDDGYLLAVLSYIHQNPVRAQFSKSAGDYRWSSDRCYRYGKAGFVRTDFILNMLSQDRKAAAAKYCKLVDREIMNKDEAAVVFQGFQLKQELDLVEPGLETAASLSIQGGLAPGFDPDGPGVLDQILRRCCSGLKEYTLVKAGSRARSLKQAKTAYVQAAREAGFTMQEIGAHISLSPPAVLLLLKHRPD